MTATRENRFHYEIFDIEFCLNHEHNHISNIFNTPEHNPIHHFQIGHGYTMFIWLKIIAVIARLHWCNEWVIKDFLENMNSLFPYSMFHGYMKSVLLWFVWWSYHRLMESCKPFTNILQGCLTPEQNGRHSADDIFIWIFVNERVCILIRISRKVFFLKGPIDNNRALV